ncbi:MAG: copper-translocating P-type ATPase [Thermoproteota archaeon]
MNEYKPVIEHMEHSGHGHAHHASEFKRKLLVSSILTIPVLILSDMIQEWFGFSFKPPFQREMLFTLSLIIYFYSGSPFLRGLIDEIRKRQPGMMTLVGTAISIAFIYSSGAVLMARGRDFFWELVTLIDIMLLGHWMEAKSILGASRALDELIKTMPTIAHRIENSRVSDIPVSELKVGDIVLVKPGEKIPSDGMVVEGESFVNEALLTGESKPIRKGVGDKVIGGSINSEGILKIRIEHTGEETYLAQVIRLVKQAQESRSRTQDLANRAAALLFYLALTAGIITFSVWFLLENADFALERMVTVLVIACPHALGLAIPLVVALSTTIMSRNGVLIRDRRAFEAIKDVNTVVFDKTGTLTRGSFEVSDVIAFIPEDELLSLTASVESNSEHVIAKAIVRYARRRGVEFLKADEFKALPGRGTYGKVNGREILVGSQSVLEEMGIKLVDNRVVKLHNQGKTLVFTIVDGKPAGVFALSDRVREESYEAVERLKKLGLNVYMLTGDSEEVAKWVAGELKIDDYFARVLPDEKAGKIRLLKEKGLRVAMVGDGINDAPALITADVGIAIGAGTDVAIESADIILVRNDPRDVVKTINLSRKTYAKMLQNLLWATCYNTVTIPLAAGVLYGYGILLPPAMGALIMSLSTIIVALNSQTLKKYEPKVTGLKEKKHIVIDPVCGMTVSPEDAYGKLEHGEYVIYFCSKHCQEEFNRNMGKYLAKLEGRNNIVHEHHH